MKPRRKFRGTAHGFRGQAARAIEEISTTASVRLRIERLKRHTSREGSASTWHTLRRSRPTALTRGSRIANAWRRDPRGGRYASGDCSALPFRASKSAVGLRYTCHAQNIASNRCTTGCRRSWLSRYLFQDTRPVSNVVFALATGRPGSTILGTEAGLGTFSPPPGSTPTTELDVWARI